ncbi:ABC transporter substrate-binding protein [Vibrio sp. WXL103]|uniref:ABC transporter substrate-binding protein n=1 Tax=Vibrio sp. WXL103 TaxID=3450710 RepID=UPI003EC93BDB
MIRATSINTLVLASSVLINGIYVNHALASDVTLTYMSWDPSQLEVERQAIEAFESAHPGVRVKTTAVASKHYWTRLSALAAGKTMPDVFMMSSGFIKEWSAADLLADLTEQADETVLNGYYPAASAAGVVEGRRFAMPQNWVAPVLYYNIDMFEAAGVPLPKPDWTWQDFLAAAKALTLDHNEDGKIDQWGMWMFGRYAHIDAWVFRNGGQYLTDDASALSFNPAAVSTLKFLNDLIQVHKVAPKPQEMEGIRHQDVMPMGLAAMFVDGSWFISNTRDIVGDQYRWGIAQVPLGPDAKGGADRAYTWSDMLSISADSPNKDLAWKFIQHMSGGERSVSDYRGGKIPAYIATAESADFLEQDQQPANKHLLLEIGQQNTYSGFSANWSAWRGYGASGSGGLNGELDQAFNGRKSIEEAIDAATAYGNQVLNN